jgi:uncharacterized protein YkwD
MEGSERRILQLRTALPTLVLAGVVALAGCGGGGGSDSAAPLAPVPQASTQGGLVTADGTQALVGPAGRATARAQHYEDRARKVSAQANHKTKPQKKNGVDSGPACNDSGASPSDGNEDQLAAAVLCLVNAERTALGLPALTENPQLDEAARGMAQRMVTEHFFSHDTPDGKNVVERIEPTGYIPNSGDWVVGENLAWGSGGLSTPAAIVNGWMNSPGHKANILAPDYKDIGLAVAMGSPSASVNGGTVYVNDFGAKSGADLDAKLPPESGSSGRADAASKVAGTKVAANANKANVKRKPKKHKRHQRQRHSR